MHWLRVVSCELVVINMSSTCTGCELLVGCD